MSMTIMEFLRLFMLMLKYCQNKKAKFSAKLFLFLFICLLLSILTSRQLSLIQKTYANKLQYVPSQNMS